MPIPTAPIASGANTSAASRVDIDRVRDVEHEQPDQGLEGDRRRDACPKATRTPSGKSRRVSFTLDSRSARIGVDAPQPSPERRRPLRQPAEDPAQRALLAVRNGCTYVGVHLTSTQYCVSGQVDEQGEREETPTESEDVADARRATVTAKGARRRAGMRTRARPWRMSGRHRGSSGARARGERRHGRLGDRRTAV